MTSPTNNFIRIRTASLDNVFSNNTPNALTQRTGSAWSNPSRSSTPATPSAKDVKHAQSGLRHVSDLVRERKLDDAEQVLNSLNQDVKNMRECLSNSSSFDPDIKLRRDATLQNIEQRIKTLSDLLNPHQNHSPS